MADKLQPLATFVNRSNNNKPWHAFTLLLFGCWWSTWWAGIEKLPSGILACLRVFDDLVLFQVLKKCYSIEAGCVPTLPIATLFLLSFITGSSVWQVSLPWKLDNWHFWNLFKTTSLTEGWCLNQLLMNYCFRSPVRRLEISIFLSMPRQAEEECKYWFWWWNNCARQFSSWCIQLHSLFL